MNEKQGKLGDYWVTNSAEHTRTTKKFDSWLSTNTNTIQEMSCSPELLAWAENCYAEEEAKKKLEREEAKFNIAFMLFRRAEDQGIDLSNELWEDECKLMVAEEQVAEFE